MSVLSFTLKTEHLALLKALNWSQQGVFILSAENPEEDKSPFGGDDIYEDIDVILNGKPADFNPVFTDEPPTYTDEQKAEWDKLVSELPMALEVVLRAQTFELGEYKAKYHQRYSWKKK